jgi:hypothetical protein
MWNMLDDIIWEHTVETFTQEKVFASTFDVWRVTHPTTWAIDITSRIKPLGLRIDGTAEWKEARLDKGYSVRFHLPEVEQDALFGSLPIRNKIAARLFSFFSPDDVASLTNHVPKSFTKDKQTTQSPGGTPPKYRSKLVVQSGLEFATLMRKQWRPSVAAEKSSLLEASY